jgi:hypothetical protein
MPVWGGWGLFAVGIEIPVLSLLLIPRDFPPHQTLQHILSGRPYENIIISTLRACSLVVSSNTSTLDCKNPLRENDHFTTPKYNQLPTHEV